jgi:hypothetical protein
MNIAWHSSVRVTVITDLNAILVYNYRMLLSSNLSVVNVCLNYSLKRKNESK